MPKHHEFVRDEVLPSWWANAVQEGLSTVSPNFRLRRVNGTTIEIQAGTGDDQVGLSIDGLWRWRTTTVQRSVGAGPAGVYGVFAVGAANDIDEEPLPFTDNTIYPFGLRIEAPGEEPDLIDGVAVFRKIGEVVWDGAAITRVRQLLGHDTTLRVEATTEHANEVPVVARGAASQVAPLFRAEDSTGARVFEVAADGTLLFGAAGDTNLRRQGANVLLTDDGFSVGQTLWVNGSTILAGNVAHSGGLVGFFGAAPVGKPDADDEIKAALTALGLLTDGGATPLNLDGGQLDAGDAHLTGSLELDGTLNHDGGSVGFYGRTPTARNGTPFTNGAGVSTNTYALGAAFTLNDLAALVMTLLKHLGDVNGVGLVDTTGI
jgi:hypothetical protein